MAICVGCGLEVVGGILQVDVDGTTITCGGSGIAVVTPYPGISADACNAIKLGTDSKIWSPCPEGIAGINTTASIDAGLVPTVMTTPPADFHYRSVVVNILNTSACCTVSGQLHIAAGLNGDLATSSRLDAHMSTSIDGGGFITAVPASDWILDNTTASTMIWACSLTDDFLVTLAPGADVDIQFRISLTLQSGSGNVNNLNVMEMQWVLVPTSCGC